MALFRKYLLAGLLVWLPLAITVWVLLWVLGLMDGIFGGVVGAAASVLPQAMGDALRELKNVRGLGVLTLVLLLLGTGVFAANIVGQWWLKQWDRVLHQVPIVKSIYSSVKQVSDTLFSSKGNAFREAVLVEYPRAGSWTIAFVTGTPAPEVAPLLGDGREHVSIYVPTTPNPTSGFFLMVPKHQLRPLAMSVDAALKHIISMGVVAPSTPAAAAAPSDPNPIG
ncbi:DUF502 domain-containing protein [Inhella crocodyli]|jgi:uncharacterized membrane protein|uniref:DUF502 domain-containing protein n=1 Tax=Inhella crocodyli TaxID=2499851 RepID=A0A3S2VJ23_9BURK|nr:DUF502 domain-containing protein [Inhella crocodyli]RVT88459.1 DUF502 domain-containing protein [Inhella crocodyli]